MLEIIKESVTTRTESYYVVYGIRYAFGWHNYKFPCDASGNISTDGMDGFLKEKYELCLKDGTFIEVRDASYEVTTSPVGRCSDCGEEISLPNYCECNHYWSYEGQRI